MSVSVSIEQSVAVTKAIPMWSRIVTDALDQLPDILPPGSKVAEVGYGDGYLTSHLAQRLGWRITGFDMLKDAYEQASEHVREAGVDHLVKLKLVDPEETWRHQGQYDGVFIKTVLYNAETPEIYARWLDWVSSVLKPGGIFVNFENGKANLLTYCYRKLRGRYYSDLCMFDSRILSLYEERFDIAYLKHYGAISQFLSPIPILYQTISTIEETLFKRTADNSYITALIAINRRVTDDFSR